MKKRWIAIALLTVLLMGIGGAIGKVGVRQESDGSAYALYFVERDLRSADGGDALRSEERTLEDSGLSTEELAAVLVAELPPQPASRAAVIPARASPLPPRERPGLPVVLTQQRPSGAATTVPAPFSTTTAFHSRAKRQAAPSRSAARTEVERPVSRDISPG